MRSSIHGLLVCVALLGCGEGSSPAGPTGPRDVGPADAADAGFDAPSADAAMERTALRTCLEGGGSLVERRAIDNQVLVAHGAIVAMAVSRRGQISVASTDGSLKFWSPFGPGASYDTAFDEGTAVVRALVYGADGTYLVAGDDDGLVSLENATGGAPRDTLPMAAAAIATVAVNDDDSLVAAATSGPDGSLGVWSPSDGGVTGPIATAVEGVTTLHFVGDTLVVAGSTGGAAALELRRASAPDEALGLFTEPGLGPISDVAVSADGARLVAVGDGFLVVLDAAAPSSVLLRADATGHDALGVALDREQEEAVTIGRDDTIRVFSLDDGVELARVASPDLVAIEREPSSGQLVVAGSDAFIRLYECDR